MEVWKEVLGYEDLYEVSNLGKVRTKVGKTTHSDRHGSRVWKQRILKQKTDKNGYKRVNLWKNKMSKTFLVHRLVAIAFLDAVDGKNYINHKDGNPSNNYLENLEWCTHKENLMHAFENELNKSPDQIVLFNSNTKESVWFLSKAEASKYLGRNQGFVSAVLKKGEIEVDEYVIFTKPSLSKESD